MGKTFSICIECNVYKSAGIYIKVKIYKINDNNKIIIDIGGADTGFLPSLDPPFNYYQLKKRIIRTYPFIMVMI